MAKGQKHSNREIKKPKKTPAEKAARSDVASVPAVFAKQGKGAPGAKKR